MGHNKETTKMASGIKIKTIAWSCLIVCLLLMSMIYVGIFKVDHKYRDLMESSQDCVEGQRCAIALERASNYLTEQVHLFVALRRPEDMQLYFDEVESKERENVVKELEKLYGETDPETVAELKEALRESNELETLEIHAMRLIADANGMSVQELPEKVAAWELTEEEKQMSESELVAEANHLVYGDEYMQAKQQIKGNIEETLDLLTEQMAQRQKENGAVLRQTFVSQRVFMFFIILMILFVFGLITALVIYPMREHVRAIRADRKWKTIGVYEMRYLSDIYNELYEKNRAFRKELEYKANYDVLTGIANRASFEKKKKELSELEMPVALALADVNEFKRVNDTQGHEMGDQALKKVAWLLSGLEFEQMSCVARIGGDEFALIFQNVSRDFFPQIEQKIREVNAALQQDGEIPDVSISVGIAFSEHGFSSSLFRHADQALYCAKRQEDIQCSMYEGTDDESQ